MLRAFFPDFALRVGVFWKMVANTYVKHASAGNPMNRNPSTTGITAPVLCLAAVLASVAGAAEPSYPQISFPLAAVAPGGKEAFVSSESLMGRVLDNVANAGRQGSGFNPLVYRAHPEKAIYSTAATGLNFEHIFNGVAADRAISMFTPRKDTVELVQASSNSVTLHWPAEHSSWDMDCQMTYTLTGDAIDIEFAVTPTRDRFGKGYAAFMWASYMACTRDRKIHFYGEDDGREGWVAFGEDHEGGFETGTVSFRGVEPLPYEAESQTLNIVEHPTKRFSKPFYYGLMDGDHDLSTTNDTLAYIMMFDQEAPIRFAMWNFVKDATTGKADPHRPAWDWQFVIHNPVPGTR
ncbi:MAG TPA: hypothetical protein DCY13_05245, partial [Verrucomicrobiales bacterium]|nr:hypothetical protein [Verrucomicrobiales bacterium]